MALYELNGQRPVQDQEGAWVAPSADIIGDVVIHGEATIWFNAVVRADNTQIVIGRGSNVQDGAVLHSDPGSPLTIGANVTIGHRAVVHGCTIGDDVLIGMGAIIMNGAVIGEGSIVGAGALILEGKHFPPRSLIVGSPATRKNISDLANSEELRNSARHYSLKGRNYSTGLQNVDR